MSLFLPCTVPSHTGSGLGHETGLAIRVLLAGMTKAEIPSVLVVNDGPCPHLPLPWDHQAVREPTSATRSRTVAPRGRNGENS